MNTVGSLRRLTRAAWPALLGLPLSGCAATVGEPRALWLLWLVPALVIAFALHARARRRLLRRFAAEPLLVHLVPGRRRARRVLGAFWSVLAVAALALALAGPQYGFTWDEIKRRGVDIVIALDVSDSMLVEDGEASGRLPRLVRAKREISDLLRILDGDRVGLVAFAGSAFLECPLTLDYGAARLFLDAFDTDLIPVKGTAIGEALRTSLRALEGSPQNAKAIVLITDGEDHEGAALAAAAEAKRQGVRVFAIGIGREQGAPIPLAGGGFRRDPRGEIVLSRLDEATLQRIALETGGRYVRSVTGDMDLEQIYAQGIKATLEEQELGSRRLRRFHDRFQWALAVALCALLLQPLLDERSRNPRGAAGNQDTGNQETGGREKRRAVA